MELEFEQRGIPWLKPLLRELQTQEQTRELRLSDGMPDIGQVLACWGQVILRGKEWRSDSIQGSGGVMLRVLYAPEDGTEPRTLESWIPMQMKWNLPEDRRDGHIRLTSLLRFLDARSVSPRKIMVRCGVSVLGEAYCPETAKLSVPGKQEGDVQLLTKRYPVRIPVMAGEKTFTLEEELTPPAASADIRQLLAYTLEPRIQECRVMSGKLVFRGVAQLHLVCLTEEGKVASWDHELPISQFAELETDPGADAMGDIRMGVTSLELEKDEEDHLHLKCGLVGQFLVDKRELLEVVEDAYSPFRQVEPIPGELELFPILEQKQTAVPVRQSLNLSAGTIADVSYLPDFPELHRGGEVEMELPGRFQVLYYDENGGLQSAMARTEEKVSMEADGNSRVDAVILPGAPAAATAGSGIELRGESILQTQTSARHGIPMVTGLRIGGEGEKDPHRPSLILRRAGKGRLWDIAKSTGSTVDAICSANGLSEEPEESRILLIPVS